MKLSLPYPLNVWFRRASARPASDPPPATVTQNGPVPPGTLPLFSKTWIGAVAVIAISIGGSTTTPTARATAKSATPLAASANPGTIEKYKADLDENLRKVDEEQRQLAIAKQQLAAAPAAGQLGAGVLSQPTPYVSGPPGGGYQPQPPLPPEKSAIEQDKEKREYLSLFASNLALTYRKESPAAAVADKSLATSGPIDRPPLNQAAALPVALPIVPIVRPTLKLGSESGHNVFEGPLIEAALTNRLDGSFNGPVNCIVTSDVYSHDHQILLIPQGSRVLGEAKRIDSFGQQRLAVAFHRLIMPDGYSVNLDQFTGLNQEGDGGLKDQINHHYVATFGTSIALGMLAGFSQFGAGGNLFNGNGVDAYREGVASNLSQSGTRIMDRQLNILPTVTIREGHRVKIYLSRDLQLPDYQNHPKQEEL